MKITKTVYYLPPELLSEVLKWLPAKNLLKLRLVCKSWNSVISDQRFHQQHYLHQLRTKNIQSCKYYLLSVDRYEPLPTRPYYVKSPEVNICKSRTLEIIHNIDVTKFCHGKISILGYVDGVLLVRVTPPNAGNSTNSIFLWNPMLRKVIDIPFCESLMKSKNVNVRFGFGFDSGSNNCKVVALNLNLKYYNSKTKVYNLGSRSWTSPKEKRRSIDNVDYSLKNSVSFNFEGGIYWLAGVERKGNKNNATDYLRFDLSSEGFTCSKLPDFKYDGKLKQRSRSLSTIHESLALVDCSGDHSPGHIRVWMRRKENTTSIDAWIVLYNLDYSLKNFLHLSSDGDAYLQSPRPEYRRIIVNDLESGKQEDCSRVKWGAVNFMDDYTESLALLGQPSSRIVQQ